MGPTGGKHGYSAITGNLKNSRYEIFMFNVSLCINLSLFIFKGHVGWGISWYINGLLIPEINVIRGKTYTFVTEGGFDPNIPARYHPFYITDDPVGGYEHKTPEERAVSTWSLSFINDCIYVNDIGFYEFHCLFQGFLLYLDMYIVFVNILLFSSVLSDSRFLPNFVI